MVVGGEEKRYTPDFYVPEWDSYIETKGNGTISGMAKVAAAIAAGHKVGIVRKVDLEAWCGCTIGRMDKTYLLEGKDAVLGLIVKSGCF